MKDVNVWRSLVGHTTDCTLFVMEDERARLVVWCRVHNQEVLEVKAPSGVPVARSSDPQTSWEAANSLRDLPDMKRRIVILYDEFGYMTDDELVRRYRSRFPQLPRSSSGIRTRRRELADLGVVVVKGYKTGQSGRRMTVWGRS